MCVSKKPTKMKNQQKWKTIEKNQTNDEWEWKKIDETYHTKFFVLCNLGKWNFIHMWMPCLAYTIINCCAKTIKKWFF